MLLFHEEKKLKARVRLTSHNILEVANPSRIHRYLNLGTLFRLNGNPLVPALDAATEGADLGCFIAPKAEGDVQSLDVSSYLGRGVRRDALLTAAVLTGTICLRKRLRRDALLRADRRDILGQKG